jgi:hypothetical protein
MLGVWSGTGTAPVLHEFTFPPTSGPRGIVFCKFFSCEEKNQLKAVERLKPKTSWTKLLNATRTWYVTRRVWMILNDFEWFCVFVCVCVVKAQPCQAHIEHMTVAKVDDIFLCSAGSACRRGETWWTKCSANMRQPTFVYKWSHVVCCGLDTHDPWISWNFYEAMGQNASCSSKAMQAEHAHKRKN